MNLKKYIPFLSLITVLFCFQNLNSQSFNGYALYNLQNQNTTYLIDDQGNIAHNWSCSSSCNYTVLLKENGNIVRGTKYNNNQLNGAAVGGKIQELDPNANVVWEYVYSNSDHVSHHDITLLPNGNVILTAWEVKSTAELIQAGFDNPSSEKWPTHFVELQQNGTSADIVWEWHIWDHLIQDHDPTKDNYGIVANHPELMDINAVSGGGGPGGGGPGGGGPGGGGGDWFHVNGVDYNEDLDQLVFSSRFASEIFIIDHSTTTAEAAGHTGGNSGMGGDFLYRWGNPSNYGSSASQTIPNAVHDPRWIKDDGRPLGGYIQYFNNSGAPGGGSTVEAIQAPENGYLYNFSGNSYGPANYDFQHVCLASANGQSASDAMSNGNIFVNVSQNYMYEVDQTGNVVWQYNAGPTKAFRYECDHPGIIALLGEDPCGLLSVSEQTLSKINIYPNPSNGIFLIDGFILGENSLSVKIIDVFGKVVLETKNSLNLDLTNFEDGVYFVSLNFNNEKEIVRKISLIR
ncbi:MAG: hypothetical protein CL844_03355 [Crocinitomicaceae bacterium]|nr:hypothetical protein [Crocinitomicaceae bacterium]|tara:strand:- start:96531 stop:98078 length:1548 start_codon:yes stop_codon:yes gene_type:complete